jgi:hypothetical protein
MFAAYQRLCEEKQLTVGTLWLYRTPHKWILNFPTKQHWRHPSKPEYIEAGLQKFVANYARMGITSIAFPRLGCGNGELDWETQVQPLMVRHLDSLPIDVFVYRGGPQSVVPEHRDELRIRAWLRSEPRTLAFEEMMTDLRAALGTGGLRLRHWRDPSEFEVMQSDVPGPGLLLKLKTAGTWGVLAERLERYAPHVPVHLPARDEVLVPEDALLDLWQSVRAHGFCTGRMMPNGLDLLEDYVLPILELLPYMRKVELTTPTAKSGSKFATGLALFPLGACGPALEPLPRVEPVHPA